jgi:hypothetical protein
MTPRDSATPIVPAGRAWGLELDSRTALVGPLTGFRRHTPAVTVTVVPSDEVAGGELTGHTEVAESAAAFAVDYYRFDGREGLFHHSGGNWILWNPDQPWQGCASRSRLHRGAHPGISTRSFSPKGGPGHRSEADARSTG